LDIDWSFRIIILFVFLFLAAFFSGCEVALFSLDKRKLKNSLDSSPLIGRYLLTLVEHPRRLLVTILVGNTIVSVAASIVSVSLALDIQNKTNLSPELVLTLQIIILTILIIVFAELTPKVWASKNPLRFSKIVSIPLYWFSAIIYPVSETLTEVIRFIVSKMNFDRGKAAISPEEITELAEIGHEIGTLEEEEHGIIQSIVSIKSVTVHEVMTPRVDMTVVPHDIIFTELVEIIKESGHSRIPVYKDSLDNITGIAYAKDVLPYIRKNGKPEFDVMKIVRTAMFIPKTKIINDLMYEFQDRKMHIAIVVDEYGGTAGLITLEDIIEEIVGEIRDEYDKEENPVSKIDDNKFIVMGKIPIDELNELLNTNISSEKEDYETLAGLVLNNAGHIPKEGYNFNMENFKFTVKEVSKKRINKVLIEKVSAE
jgi:magnesium and cobalt exporter, CNNM family